MILFFSAKIEVNLKSIEDNFSCIYFALKYMFNEELAKMGLVVYTIEVKLRKNLFLTCFLYKTCSLNDTLQGNSLHTQS